MRAESDRQLVVSNLHVRVMILLIRDVRNRVHEAHRLVEILKRVRSDDLVASVRPFLELGQSLFDLRPGEFFCHGRIVTGNRNQRSVE